MTLRGHGDADRPADGYSPADLATDMAALLDDAGAESAVLVGHSSGSQVALRFAVTYPPRTDGLVLVGAPGTVRDHPGRAQFDQAFSTIADPIDPRSCVGSSRASSPERCRMPFWIRSLPSH